MAQYDRFASSEESHAGMPTPPPGYGVTSPCGGETHKQLQSAATPSAQSVPSLATPSAHA